MYAGELFFVIKNNIAYSSLLVIVTLILGSAFSAAADKCDRSFRMGRSLDTVAGWFSITSFGLYTTSAVLFVVLGYIGLSDNVVPALKDASNELIIISEQMVDCTFVWTDDDKNSIREDLETMGFTIEEDEPKGFVSMAKETIAKADAFMGIVNEDMGTVIIWE